MISIVVPIYNVETYLRECVDSILAQTYQNIEVILVDDGSTDGSGRICDEYGAMYDYVKVVHKENGGLSSARNEGIKKATGSYIAFVDSDDWVDANMMESLLHEIERSSTYVVANCQPILFFENGDTYLPWCITKNSIIAPCDILRFWLSEESNHYIPTKLFRRCVFDHLLFKEDRVDEDTFFTYELGKIMENEEWNMVELSFAPYHYRQRSGSICHDSVKPLRVDRLTNLDEIKKDLMSFKPELIHYVDRLRVRSLELFVTEVRHNKLWRKEYLRSYTKALRAVDNATAKLYISPDRYRRFLIAKYWPVWFENVIRYIRSIFRRISRMK